MTKPLDDTKPASQLAKELGDKIHKISQSDTYKTKIGTIDDKIDKLLYEYSVWRDYYYSDFEDGVMTSKEWIKIRDNIQKEARDKLKELL